MKKAVALLLVFSILFLLTACSKNNAYQEYEGISMYVISEIQVLPVEGLDYHYTFSYDEMGRLTEIYEHSVHPESIVYVYGDHGFVSRMDIWRGNWGSETREFDYDFDDGIMKSASVTIDGSEVKEFDFFYDGNRKINREITECYEIMYFYDDAGQINQIHYEFMNEDDENYDFDHVTFNYENGTLKEYRRVSKYEAETREYQYEYDASGNLLPCSDDLKLTYDEHGNLVEAEYDNGHRVVFCYEKKLVEEKQVSMVEYCIASYTDQFTYMRVGWCKNLPYSLFYENGLLFLEHIL